MPTAFDLINQLPKLKKTTEVWLNDVSKYCPQQALCNLEKGFQRFWAGRKKRQKVGFPCFKSRRNGAGSFYVQDVKAAIGYIQLPKIGRIRLKERGYIPVGPRIIRAVVSERAGRWFVGVLVEQDQPIFTGVKDAHAVVGVDLGVKTMAVVSDGQTFDSPKPLKRRLRKLARLNRSMHRKQKGSNNRRKATAKLARLHFKIANIRKDAIHKMTSRLTKTKSVIVIEDLHVLGLMRNRRLSRAIGDVGFGEIRRQLTYKGKWYDCDVQVADRFFPSSRICSCCGEINDALTLADRTWTCLGCKTAHDRDENASKNLEYIAVSPTEMQNAG